jgi:hypothetical protein
MVTTGSYAAHCLPRTKHKPRRNDKKELHKPRTNDSNSQAKNEWQGMTQAKNECPPPSTSQERMTRRFRERMYAKQNNHSVPRIVSRQMRGGRKAKEPKFIC